MKICAVIPARYSSQRFPGKVIHELFGKPVVVWVWERVKNIKDISSVYVATEDERVLNVCKVYGIEAIMTSPNHSCGTDRVWEVVKDMEVDIVVNVQGDEPLIKEDVIKMPIDLIKKSNFDITTAASPIKSDEHESIRDVNIVKVALENKRAVYFSRLPIPFHHQLSDVRDIIPYYRHIGVYVYRKESLERFIKLETSTLERLERLEQLRALSYGMSIGVEIVDYDAPAIDEVSDLKKAEEYILKNKILEQ